MDSAGPVAVRRAACGHRHVRSGEGDDAAGREVSTGKRCSHRRSWTIRRLMEEWSEEDRAEREGWQHRLPACRSNRVADCSSAARRSASGRIGPAGTVHYTVDGTEPEASSPVYTAPFTITTNTTLQAVTIGRDGKTSRMKSADVHKGGTPFREAAEVHDPRSGSTDTTKASWSNACLCSTSSHRSVRASWSMLTSTRLRPRPDGWGDGLLRVPRYPCRRDLYLHGELR